MKLLLAFTASFLFFAGNNLAFGETLIAQGDESTAAPSASAEPPVGETQATEPVKSEEKPPEASQTTEKETTQKSETKSSQKKHRQCKKSKRSKK